MKLPGPAERHLINPIASVILNGKRLSNSQLISEIEEGFFFHHFYSILF